MPETCDCAGSGRPGTIGAAAAAHALTPISIAIAAPARAASCRRLTLPPEE
jgi:hypothetical protein